jgi:hypothetical protein
LSESDVEAGAISGPPVTESATIEKPAPAGGPLHRARSPFVEAISAASDRLRQREYRLVVAALITLLTWAPAIQAPGFGLDASWRAAMAMALERHIQFGSSLLFTYGPLGALSSPLLYYGSTTLLALIYLALISWLLAFMLLTVLRANFSLTVSIAVAWVLTALITSGVDGGDQSLAVGLLLALEVLRERANRRRRFLLIGTLGVLGAVQLSVKFSGGLTLIAILVVALLFGVERWRSLGTGVLVVVPAFVITWLAAGQSLSHVPSYVWGTAEVSVGYAAAMNISDPSRGAENWYGAIVLALIVFFGTVGLRRESVRSSWYGGALIIVLWTWVSFKEGYIRHDGHDVIFLGLALAAIAWPHVSERIRPMVLLALGLVAMFVVAAVGTLPANIISPVSNTKRAYHDVIDVLSTHRRTTEITEERAALQAGPDRLPASLLDDLAGHTVAIDPLEDTIAWLYPQIHWDPEPVLQSYSAYTTYLDNRDVSFFSSKTGPARILRQVVTIDNRYPYFDPPTTQLAIMCNYRQVTATGGWQVLAKIPDRCGAARLLGERKATFGQAVPVPRGPKDSIVIARLSAPVTFRGRLESLLLKPPPFYLRMKIGTSYGDYRFIAGTAADDHVLEVPNRIGYSSQFYTPSVSSLALSGGGWSNGEGTTTVTFYEVPVLS